MGKNLYDYAPEPDLVFYLDMPVDTLLKRIIGTTGLDFTKVAVMWVFNRLL